MSKKPRLPEPEGDEPDRYEAELSKLENYVFKLTMTAAVTILVVALIMTW